VPAKKFSIDGRDITIFSAIRAGDMSAVQKILQTDRLQADACDEPLGESPLHLAVSLEKHDLAVLLIDHGAKVNAITDFQRTPLHYAASSGNLEIVKLLCRNGADIFALDIRGSTPLHDAAATQNLRVYNYIESLGASDSTVDNSGQPASALIELK
jgi:ankyrin repeat protein